MNMIGVIASAVEGIQTEIIMFVLAFLLHMVVFRGRSVPKADKPKMQKNPRAARTGGNCKAEVSCAKGSPAHTSKFVTVAEGICQKSSSKSELTTQIRNELQQVPIEDQVDALTSLLQGASKSKVASEDIISVAHLLVKENDLKLSKALGECLLDGYLVRGCIAQFQQTIGAMRTSGLQLDIATFNELLDTAVKRCPKHAWTLIDEMRTSGAKPDRITCTILLKTIQTNTAPGNLERILATLDDISEPLDEILLSSIVDACLRVGRADLLEPYLRQRSRLAVYSPHTYGSIIRAYGFLKNVKEVWNIWREMRSQHVVPNSITLGCVVEALITNGDVEAGYEFIHDISKDEVCSHQINAVIYGSVLKGFAQRMKFDRVWSVYQEMLDRNLKFSIVTFNTLVDACARSREMSRIPTLLASMVEQGIEPNIITYSAILKGYCQANRLDEAFQLLEQMVQTTELRPDEIMYNTLLDGCARQGLYDKGMELLQEMQQVGVPPTNFTLSVLVKLASRSKRLDRAFELCDEISTKYKFQMNTHVYSNLVHGCVASRDLRRAIDVLENMVSKRVRPDARIYENLLRACIAERRAQDASGLLRAAMGLQGVHPQLAGKPANLLQPQGRITADLIEQVLEGIAGPCKHQDLAVELLQALRRVKGVYLDPKLQLRLASKSGQL